MHETEPVGHPQALPRQIAPGGQMMSMKSPSHPVGSSPGEPVPAKLPLATPTLLPLPLAVPVPRVIAAAEEARRRAIRPRPADNARGSGCRATGRASTRRAAGTALVSCAPTTASGEQRRESKCGSVSPHRPSLEHTACRARSHESPENPLRSVRRCEPRLDRTVTPPPLLRSSAHH